MKKIIDEIIWLAICVAYCLGVIALVIVVIMLISGGVLLDGTSPRFEGGQM